MIQRKQTVFLLLAVLAYVLCLFFPIGCIEPQGMGAPAKVYNLGVVAEESGISILGTCVPLFILTAVSAILSLVNIFLYRNRLMQINLCGVTALFTILWCVDYALLFTGVVPVDDFAGTFSIRFAACFPIVALILVLLARKGVKDDERLVRAADRIR